MGLLGHPHIRFATLVSLCFSVGRASHMTHRSHTDLTTIASPRTTKRSPLPLHYLCWRRNTFGVPRTQGRDDFGQGNPERMSDSVESADFGGDSTRLDFNDGLAVDTCALRETINGPAPLPSQARDFDTESAQVRYRISHSCNSGLGALVAQ